MIAMLRTQTDTRSIIEPQTTPFRLSPRNFQAFSTPQTFDSLVVHLSALLPKQHRDTTISITTILARQSDHATEQTRFVVRNMSFPTLRRSPLPENTTSTTLRNAIPAQSVSHMLDSPTTLRRTQKFPDAASRRIALSSFASASSFFRREFSRSSSFRRFA